MPRPKRFRAVIHSVPAPQRPCLPLCQRWGDSLARRSPIHLSNTTLILLAYSRKLSLRAAPLALHTSSAARKLQQIRPTIQLAAIPGLVKTSMAAPAASAVATSPSQPSAQLETQQQPLADVDHAVVHQVEWYFGEINLQRDFFLKGRMDENFWVALSVVAGFNKMKLLGVYDTALLAALLARASSLVEVDLERNCVRPVWAKRAVVAVTSVPVGSPDVDVEKLILDASSLGKPISIKCVGVDENAIWQADFAAIEEARDACEQLGEESIDGTSLNVRLIPAFDLAPIAPGAYVPQVVPGAQLGTYFDGSGGNGMPMPGYPGGMPGGMLHPMNGMGLQGSGYGFVPGGSYSPGGGGSNGYGVNGGGFSPSNGQNQNNGYSAGGGQFYANSYGQGYDRSGMASQQQQQSSPGLTGRNQQSSAAPMEAATASTAGANTGTRTANPNGVNARHHVPNVGIPGSGIDASQPGQQQQRNRNPSRQQRPNNQNNNGSSTWVNQARHQGANGADGSSPPSGSRTPNSTRSGGSTPGAGQDLGNGAKTSGGSGQGNSGGNRKVGGGNGVGGSGAPGSDNRSQKAQGVTGDGRQAGTKSKKKKGAHRQSASGQGGGSGDEGKKGEDARKVEEQKASKPEANVTKMYFPPLPGAGAVTNAAKLPYQATGYARTAAAAPPVSAVAFSLISPTPAVASTPKSPTPSVDVSSQDEASSQPVGTPVSASGPSVDHMAGESDEHSDDKAEKALVSDVSSTVSSGSGNGIGNQSVSPETISSTASAGSVDDPPPAAGGAGLSYATIVRTKAKKQQRAISPASSGTSESPVSGNGSLKSAKGEGVTSNSDGKGSVGARKSAAGRGEQPGTSKGNGVAKSNGGTGKGSVRGSDGENSAKASPASATAPRSVWANKPKSVLQAAAVVKQVPAKSSAGGALSPTGQNSQARTENSSGKSNGPRSTHGARGSGTSSMEKVVNARSVGSATGGRAGGKAVGKTGGKAMGKQTVGGSQLARPLTSQSAGGLATQVARPSTAHPIVEVAASTTVSSGAPVSKVPKGVWGGQNAKIWSKEVASHEKAMVKTEP